MFSMISLVQRKDIDEERWNSIIASSKQETIYPYTWFMDACTENWMALIMQDYECIMPVAVGKKYTLKYFYQPLFNQQLGVFSSKPVDSEIVRMFLQKLVAEFKMGVYAFNSGNLLGEENGIDVIDRVNYELSLKPAYAELYENYSNSIKKTIKRVYKLEMEYSEKITVEELIMLKSQNNPEHRTKAHYDRITKFMNKIVELEKGIVCGIRSEGRLLGAAMFVFSKTRMIYLMSVSDEEGRKRHAMFQLMDTFIRLHAEEDLILDFEGSSIPSIAKFFGGFGGKPQIYQRVKLESIPAKIKKLVKK